MKIEIGVFTVEVDDKDLPYGELDADKGLEKIVYFRLLKYFVPNQPPVTLGSFALAPMPGCCGVVVSTASFLNSTGLYSKEFHNIKADIAKRLGYSLMICTIQTKNFPEIISAANNGWTHGKVFRNKRTSNDIVVSMKEI